MQLPPPIAAAHTRTVLVANRRGARQHLIREDVGTFTTLMNVRRGRRPVCGQRARRWQWHLSDTRPLCARCLAWAVRQVPGLAHPYMHAPAVAIQAALSEVTDPRELHQIVMAICSREDLVHLVVTDHAPHFGGGPIQRRLTSLVPAARDRCTHTSRRS